MILPAPARQLGANRFDLPAHMGKNACLNVFSKMVSLS